MIIQLDATAALPPLKESSLLIKESVVSATVGVDAVDSTHSKSPFRFWNQTASSRMSSP
jgi:hypothetical protein